MDRESDKIRRPLPLKIAVAVFSIVLAGAAVNSYMEYRNRRTESMNGLRVQGSSITEGLAGSVERLLTKGDVAVAQRIIGNVSSLRRIKSIVVTDGRGKILLAGRAKFIGKTVPEIVSRGWETDEIIKAQKAIEGDGRSRKGLSSGFSRHWTGTRIGIAGGSGKESRGTLLVALSTVDIRRKAGIDAIRYSGQMALVALITAFVCFLVLTSTVTKPVSKLVRAVQALKNGDTSYEPLESHDDELGVLSRSFKEMAESLARREQELKSSYTDLQETQEKLVIMEKLRALGEMASGVAHDFNNILTAILGRAQLMKKNAYDEKMIKNLDVIEKAATDGASVVRRLQDFTRTRTDKSFEPVDLNEIVEDVLSFTRPRWQNDAELRGVSYRIIRSLRKVEPVLGDASELREVLTNMLVNSLDAMPDGGDIEVGTLVEEESVVVSLRDTGIGMSPEEQRRIFDPFFTTKGVRGTGLGMSVAFGIIRRHDGEILVDSNPGAGTTISIKLPVSHGQVDAKKSSGERRAIPGGVRVLVVDDEENILKVLGDILAESGCTVTDTSSGEEAMALLSRQQFDIVFTDLGMSPVPGWDVARRTKELSPNTVVCLMTGWGIELEQSGLKEKGVDHVLPKPFQISEVVALMEGAFGEKEIAPVS